MAQQVYLSCSVAVQRACLKGAQNAHRTWVRGKDAPVGEPIKFKLIQAQVVASALK